MAVRPAVRIGRLELEAPLVLAPMAAVTNPPFRRLCREQGAALVMTEMVSARGIVEDDPRAWAYVDLLPDEAPVGVQLFGCDPAEMALAARRIEERGAALVDINMGCPMKKVVSTGRGAALLETPDRAAAIVRAMAEAVSFPVTVKMRAGWAATNATDVARRLQDAGAAAITIHGRTREAMYQGHADLSVIADVCAALDIPVIGNGDVRCAASAARMMLATGCDAVMVARGCLGNPWAFADIRSWMDGTPRPIERDRDTVLAMMLRHFDHYLDIFGERKTCLDFRKHALWYLEGTDAAPLLRERMVSMQSAAQVREILQQCCAALPARLDDRLWQERGLYRGNTGRPGVVSMNHSEQEALA
jgi:nifR3 family TIM-barrel protein